MPEIARHDVALAGLDRLPAATMAALAKFLRDKDEARCSSLSQQQSAEGKFHFAAGAAAKTDASRPRHRARTRHQPPVSPQHLAALTPAAADVAAGGDTTAGSSRGSGIAVSAYGSAAATTPSTSGAPPSLQQPATTFHLREPLHAASCASQHAAAQSGTLQQQVDAAAKASTTSQPVRQSDRRSRGWWPPWDFNPPAALRHDSAPAPDAAAASKTKHAAGAHLDTQQDGAAASRSTVYDSADSLQAMTLQVTSTGHCDGLVRLHLIAQSSGPTSNINGSPFFCTAAARCAAHQGCGSHATEGRAAWYHWQSPSSCVSATTRALR
jgi:hypothetical protein